MILVKVLGLSNIPCLKNPFPKMLSPSNAFYSSIEFIDSDINSKNMIATTGKLDTTGFAYTMFAGDEEVSYLWQR
jgi:hypothetical protein